MAFKGQFVVVVVFFTLVVSYTDHAPCEENVLTMILNEDVTRLVKSERQIKNLGASNPRRIEPQSIAYRALLHYH